MKILLIGYQKASMKNFAEVLSNLKQIKNKTYLFDNKLIKKSFFKKMCKKKIEIKNFRNLKYNYVITGTSETYFEKNLWGFFFKKNIEFAAYVDSVFNIKIRFTKSDYFPKIILVPTMNVKKTIINSFPSKSRNSKIIIIGFCYLEYLKNLFKKPINNSRQFNAYFTANLDYSFELNTLLKVYNFSNLQNKKFIVFIHPRSNIDIWKRKLNKFKNMLVTNKSFFNYYKKIDSYFGIVTMALLVSSVVQNKVFYLKTNNKKNKLIKLFKFMGFGEFQITKETIKLTIMPNIKNQNLLISKKESLNTFIDNIS